MSGLFRAQLTSLLSHYLIPVMVDMAQLLDQSHAKSLLGIDKGQL
jgi:hypothetical protein